MESNNKHIEIIDAHLSEHGIIDPEIRMELSDHFCELITAELIDEELIPADILSRVDDEFNDGKMKLVYNEMVRLKRSKLGNRSTGLIENSNLAMAFIILITHRILFFVCLPLLPQELYTPFHPIAMAITAIFYIGIAVFFILKARHLMKRKLT